MSNEVESKEVVKKSKSAIIKEIIYAIIAAIISFAVAFGLITTEQEAEVKNKMQSINATATEVVEMLQNGDVTNAMAKANQIVVDTNAVKEIAKQGVDKAKEKTETSKEIVQKAVDEIKEAAKK